jgi:AcrR family transcriptional regulator
MSAPTRARRSSSELRQLILDAAARVFAREAYASVTVESIAAAAGVTRSVLYRHFDNKDDLYRATVLAPFLDAIRDFAALWQTQAGEPWDDRSLMRAMTGIFYDTFAAHREAVLVLAAQGADGALDRTVRAALDEFFDQIVSIGEYEAKRRPWISSERLDFSIRLVVGAVAAAAVLDSVILSSPPDPPTRDEIVERITLLTLHGLSLSPDRGAPVAR